MHSVLSNTEVKQEDKLSPLIILFDIIMYKVANEMASKIKWLNNISNLGEM